MTKEKKESDKEVTGLKYELGGLEKNLKEIQDTSAQSLEDLEKVRFRT